MIRNIIIRIFSKYNYMKSKNPAQLSKKDKSPAIPMYKGSGLS